MQLNKKGFTLIEILIVVAIIGILASIVLVGLGPAQKQGRDARRISDLRQVQNGLELYFQKCGYYPGDANPDSPCSVFTAATDWATMSTAITGSFVGVSSIPDDPQSNANKHYQYAVSADGSGYVLGAQLEGANVALDSDVDVIPPGYTGDLTDCFGGSSTSDSIFCVQL